MRHKVGKSEPCKYLREEGLAIFSFFIQVLLCEKGQLIADAKNVMKVEWAGDIKLFNFRC